MSITLLNCLTINAVSNQLINGIIRLNNGIIRLINGIIRLTSQNQKLMMGNLGANTILTAKHHERKLILLGAYEDQKIIRSDFTYAFITNVAAKAT